MSWLVNPTESQHDGLIYHDGFLFGVGSNKIMRYELNEDETEVVKTETDSRRFILPGEY